MGKIGHKWVEWKPDCIFLHFRPFKEPKSPIEEGFSIDCYPLWGHVGGKWTFQHEDLVDFDCEVFNIGVHMYYTTRATML